MTRAPVGRTKERSDADPASQPRYHAAAPTSEALPDLRCRLVRPTSGMPVKTQDCLPAFPRSQECRVGLRSCHVFVDDAVDFVFECWMAGFGSFGLELACF